jgi:hypothetical protein
MNSDHTVPSEVQTRNSEIAQWCAITAVQMAAAAADKRPATYRHTNEFHTTKLCACVCGCVRMCAWAGAKTETRPQTIFKDGRG